MICQALLYSTLLLAKQLYRSGKTFLRIPLYSKIYCAAIKILKTKFFGHV